MSPKPYVTLSHEQIQTIMRIAALHSTTEIDLYPTDTGLIEFVAWHRDEEVQSGAIASGGRVHTRRAA